MPLLISPFIDIHTHRRTTSAATIAVSNFSQKELFDVEFGMSDVGTQPKSDISNPTSVGLHPWFLTKENFDTDFEKLSQLVQNQTVIAIGECGLDKLQGEDIAFQTKAFEAQIRLAESVSKPVIIHCVRAYNEVVAVKKRLKPTVPLIIHGFNKNAPVLAELLRQGFFISIGAALLQKKRSDTEGSLFADSIRQIPLDRLFFETDDADSVNISDIYTRAAEILNIHLPDLKVAIYKNFRDIY